MKTTIDINSTVTRNTTNVTVSQDTPAIPAVGDDVAIPTPIAAPQPDSFQQLTVRNRIFRYEVDGSGAPYLYLLLVTDNPIT
jgi:hypothetical protein